jgi:molecular chaperone GrpE
MNEIKDNNQKIEENINGLSEMEKLQKERDEYLDGWQRARAELINFKKDEVRRFETFKNFSNEIIVRDLITVLDSFDLAIAALEKDGEAEKGIYLIKAQIEDTLKNHGLGKIIVSVDQIFDPTVHEAVAEIEINKPSGTIIEEIERGYTLNGKLIRPARVKVSK